jgi:predicted kinase
MRAIITVGIPCSGKSTWAEKFCAKEDYVEINRDNIRMHLFGLARYDDYVFTKKSEQDVTDVVDACISNSYAAKNNIVISDTNLNKKFRNILETKLETLGYTVEHKVFDIEFFDALRRNDARKDKQVPRHVMYRMYRNFLDYQEEQGEWVKYVPNNSLPSAYIVDIDGTIAINKTNRGWYDWGRVGEDEVIETTVDIVNMLHHAGNHIILLSGRDSICRKETELWLDKHSICYDHLYMRPKGSMDKDRYVKHKLFNDHVVNNFKVKAVFDDRTQVCLLWHDLGLPVFKVGDPIVEF